ncbi:MAG: threonine--tRNA ligase [Candidatus Portnoybacteria bacterium CG_4_8_14_3_um_filter_44_10]|uniref:Threonine--tRNA ligase n=6 Tax=Candidatus Portnoyibacteriota TaxID=1817913 RepID=A0A2M7IFE9_9BACT|nr:MAG: threonine--tRNA ligase [Candidatus Portnoybacteria bacterium CG_4_8_14_3_um_filter_44_10]PIZ71590.1 MAG: threonine--tRNA ligase [Candidatus Portnoybacteria bacterium CG_4_10_14_0_2_um_filter_44_20]PJA63169.1 MAG: threonine--tRNA ligase [Candidatus Portnoybacteria bacterium CG_4_9_14_3_um_filter_44_9]
MDKENKLSILRHSTAHLLAVAVLRMFPEAKLGIGPAIEDGFYYDFDLPRTLIPEDLPILEDKMRAIIKENYAFEKQEIDAKKAAELFKKAKQTYKVELIKDIQKTLEGTKSLQGDLVPNKITIYKTGSFVDLCAGPHLDSTGEIKADALKLLKIAGAYWRGDEKNKMLQRIYGTAFENKDDLDEYLHRLEETEKRDHRKIGKDLDLFIFSDLVGKGLPLFTEKGSIIRRELERFIVDEELKRGYKHVYTPEIAKVDLYKTSGHYPYYKDSMYPIMKVDNEELILRPMTCPHHFQLYASRPRTYKELPMRIAELAKQFRYEKSGELTGLIRVRSFCLADAHIICRKDQAASEINSVLDLIEYVASIFGLQSAIDYRYRLSLGDRKDNKKYFKDDEAWNFAENVLREVLTKRKSPFFEAAGEAAFYGPKIDIQMKNVAGKEDTAFTVQYDFVMPKRFNLVYADKDGLKKETVVIHRSSIGAIERFMAFLIEHYAGAFPLWLSPIQVEIIPISEKFKDYGQKIDSLLKENGIRSQMRDADETLGKRIREAQQQKINYMLIIGEKEIEADNVAVRNREQGDLGAMKIDDFIKKIEEEMASKK